MRGAAEVEAEARLAVLDHPFAAWTGPDGAFALEAVPSGELELTARAAASAAASASLRVVLETRGDVQGVLLVLP